MLPGPVVKTEPQSDLVSSSQKGGASLVEQVFFCTVKFVEIRGGEK